MTPSHRGTGVALAIACAALIVLYDLGAEAPIQTAEARVPVAARTMSRDGLSAVPTLEGEPWLKKPPLAIWLQAVSLRLGAGEPRLAALPAAFAAIALVGLVAARGGLLAGLILALCPRFLLSARGMETDTLFASLTGIAILLGLGEIERSGRVSWPSQLVLGLALVTKGPLCLVFALLAWGRGWLSATAALALLPGGAWLAASIAEHGDLAATLTHEVASGVGRDEPTHGGPIWEHAVSLTYLAWPAVLPACLLGLERLRCRLRRTPPRTTCAPDPGATTARTHAALLRWFVGGLIVLSLMSKKQTSYALPLYPALALLSAGLVPALRRSVVAGHALRAVSLVLLAAPFAAWYAGSPLGAIVLSAIAVPALGAVWWAPDAQTAYRRLLLAAVPVAAFAFVPATLSFRTALSLAPLGREIEARLAKRHASSADMAALGRNWSELAWGLETDVPRVESAAEATHLGRRYLLVETHDRANDSVDRDRVVLDAVHPRHSARRILVLDLESAIPASQTRRQTGMEAP